MSNRTVKKPVEGRWEETVNGPVFIRRKRWKQNQKPFVEPKRKWPNGFSLKGIFMSSPKKKKGGAGFGSCKNRPGMRAASEEALAEKIRQQLDT